MRDVIIVVVILSIIVMSDYLFKRNDPTYIQLGVMVSDVNDNAPVCPVQSDIQLDRSVEAGHVVVTLEVSCVCISYLLLFPWSSQP